MGSPGPPGKVAVLTSPSGQQYHFSGDEAALTVRASSLLTDDNVRQVFWPAGDPYLADQQVCMVWRTPAVTLGDPYPQPGLALRIAPSTSGGRGIRAVTITQNVFQRAIWRAWVDVWDTGRSDAPQSVANFDLYPVVGVNTHMMASPWHVCGRTRGRRVDLKVWITGAEPPWTDRRHVFAATLPAGWNRPGYAGGYIGHLRAGRVARFSGIRVLGQFPEVSLNTRMLPP